LVALGEGHLQFLYFEEDVINDRPWQDDVIGDVDLITLGQVIKKCSILPHIDILRHDARQTKILEAHHNFKLRAKNF